MFTKGLKIILFLSTFLCLSSFCYAEKVLIRMDLSQPDHLKAYGVAYWALEQGHNVEWLLNYRGGSFMIDFYEEIADESRLRGVAFKVIDLSQTASIYKEIEENNMEVVLLEKAPAIAIYTPPNKEPWDDAVTLALAYAEIPYTTLWDEEVLKGELEKYDWLHLHHEDFTGQYGKFYGPYRNALWYKQEQLT
ncbi:MAG: asparagine synthetase B, partial [candidate division Zixibacteria bacterium]|nr:asparagine synthetase B [candidate division Zixibacteria bacterium]